MQDGHQKGNSKRGLKTEKTSKTVAQNDIRRNIFGSLTEEERLSKPLKMLSPAFPGNPAFEGILATANAV